MRWRLLAGVVALGLVGFDRVAGSEPFPQRGQVPSATYDVSEGGTVNVVSGNLAFQVPLATLPLGRAGLTASLGLTYNSQIYDLSWGECWYDAYGERICRRTLRSSEEGGWRWAFRYGVYTDWRRLTRRTGTCSNDEYYEYRLRLVLPDGSSHVLHPRGYTGDAEGYYGLSPSGLHSFCGGTQQVSGTLRYYTDDGTHIRVDIAASSGPLEWEASLPDGTRVEGYNDVTLKLYDRQGSAARWGNAISFEHITGPTGDPVTLIKDDVGREIRVEYDSASDQHRAITKQLGGTADLVATVQWGRAHSRAFRYQCTEAGELCPAAPAPIGHRVVTEVQTPIAGLAYKFGYSGEAQLGYGELREAATLRNSVEDGKVTYTYVQEGQNKTLDTLTTNQVTSKTVTWRDEFDGAASVRTETWSYTYSNTTTQVLDPAQGTTTYHYHNPNMLSFWWRGLVWRVTEPNGDMVERLWARNRPFGGIGSQPGNPYVRAELRTAAGTTARTNASVFTYDKNGNLIERAEYDWPATVGANVITRDGQSRVTAFAPTAAPLRRTRHTYEAATNEAPASCTVDTTCPAAGDEANAYWHPSAPRLRTARTSTRVRNASNQDEAYTTLAYDAPLVTGNVTQERRWSGAIPGAAPATLNGTNSVLTSRTYDQYGNVVTETNPRGAVTRYTYGDITAADQVVHRDLYPTKVEQAYGTTVQRNTTFIYDHATGLPTIEVDVDNGLARSYGRDTLGRLTSVVESLGATQLRRSITERYDAQRRVVTRRDVHAFGDSKQVTVEHFDTRGRLRLVRTTDDNGTALNVLNEIAAGGVKRQIRHRTFGAYTFRLESNPYRANTSAAAGGEAAMGWTRTALDRMGRVVEVAHFTGTALPYPWDEDPTAGTEAGTTSIAYDADQTTITDPASKKRRETRDGLGRLTGVAEGVDTTLAATTNYAYYALDGLRQVTQGVQTRTFTYDALGRLLTATNPESGTTSYAYDANGNLTSRDTGRVSLSAFYDELDRPLTRTYSDDTPRVDYTYDQDGVSFGQGRLSWVTAAGVSTTSYTYDALGRVASSVQNTADRGYAFAYAWNLADQLTAVTYPSGRRVTTTYSDAARPTTLGATINGTAQGAYATAVTHAAHGALASATLGSGLSEQRAYNGRLQPATISLSRSGDAALSLSYGYGTTANNGNVLTHGISANRPALGSQPAHSVSLTQSFAYDALNRLATASEGGSWAQANGYDRWGSRWVTSGLSYGDPRTPAGPGRIGGGNRLTNVTYTEDGHVQAMPGDPRSYAYDGEGRLKTAYNGMAVVYQFGYDGDGRRVTMSELGRETTFVYDALGRLAAEYGPVAESQAGGRRYVTTDALGSVRLTTDATGGDTKRRDFAPFGEALTQARSTAQGYSGSGTGLRQGFTGQERDPESDLDYMQARYYSAAQGRFTSPDAPLIDQHPEDPQSWNLYSYVRNNPLKYIDPTGNDCIYTGTFNEKAGTVVVETGSCSFKGGTYVPGTIDSVTHDSRSSTLDYGYTTYKGGVASVGSTSLPDPGLMALKEAGNRASRDITTIAVAQGLFATAYISTYLGPAVLAALAAGGEAGVLTFGSKTFEIFRDATGKVHHENLPKYIPRNVTRDQLELAAQELRGSIRLRQQLQVRLGEKGNHGLRIAEEQRLLYRIEKRLGLR